MPVGPGKGLLIRPRRGRIPGWGLCLGLLVLTGCSTLGNRSQPAAWLGIFPEDSSVYLGSAADSPLVTTLLANTALPPSAAAASLLSRTTRIYASFVWKAGAETEYRLILRGHFSYWLIHMALDLAPDWRRGGDPLHYFIHESGLKIANPDGNTLILTNGEIQALRDAYVYRTPREFHFPARMEDPGPTMSFCYFPSLAAIPAEIPLNRRALPLLDAWFTLNSLTEESLLAGGGFHLQEEAAVRPFFTGFRSFLLWWLREGGISMGELSSKIKAIEFQAEDTYLLFQNLNFSAAQLDACLDVLLKDAY